VLHPWVGSDGNPVRWEIDLEWTFVAGDTDLVEAEHRSRLRSPAVGTKEAVEVSAGCAGARLRSTLGMSAVSSGEEASR
jgi:hypothetical protein